MWMWTFQSKTVTFFLFYFTAFPFDSLSLKTIAIYIEVGFILCISLTISLKVLTFFLCGVIIVIIFGCAVQHVGL